ncbi:MAG: Bifunctional protein GlmU [Candidatus Woesearchaeota archaeon]|nr:Bifunctional protein GlmU [Candidatus Woesearchaeota archaeon]
MKIIVVAGGLATRIKPITEKIPKCLIDINGVPLVERQLMYFRKSGFKNFIFCVAHMAEKVEEYFGDGSNFGINVEYVEDNLMGTAGAVKLAENLINGDFIVYFADILTSIDFNKLVEFHKNKNALGTVCLRPLPKGYKSSSVITLHNNKKIKSFLEKPSMEKINRITEPKFINSSTYVFKKQIFKHIPADEKYDFGKQLFPKLVEQKENLFGYPTTEFFREIGRMEKYERFMKEFNGVDNILK